ncbi:MAG: sigma-70 family RNA polymerase sigma factor, partial [Mariprofundaceae bacterium]|nr:sigma-70 family RNA polymerase sigma factor [Mariprofundaceae bacterium]
SWSIVKLGTNKLQRKIFAGLQKARNAIAALEGDRNGEVGAEFGLSGSEYQEAAAAFIQRDMSLDADVEGQAMVAALPANEATPEEAVLEKNWQSHRQGVLRSAMKRLPERDRMIVERRHLADNPATLKDLSEELGISIERVRQLEARAMNRLKEYAN